MNYQDYQKNKERKFPIGAKVVFWNTQIIPAILSWITFTLFLISYAKGKSKGWLPWIWAFNASIWTIHQIIG